MWLRYIQTTCMQTFMQYISFRLCNDRKKQVKLMTSHFWNAIFGIFNWSFDYIVWILHFLGAGRGQISKRDVMFGQHTPGTECNLVLSDGSHGERSVVLGTVTSIQGHNRRWQPQSATVMCLRGHAERHIISGSFSEIGSSTGHVSLLFRVGSCQEGDQNERRGHWFIAAQSWCDAGT